MERALRRSGLPVEYTSGFNPHPRVSFDPALPLGYESEAEGIRITFQDDISPPEAVARLNAVLPPDLQLVRWREDALDRHRPVRYELQIPCPGPSPEEVLRFLGRDSVVAELPRKGKVDLRPFVASIERDEDQGNGFTRMRMTLLPVGDRTVRPEQVLAALRAGSYCSDQGQASPEDHVRVLKLPEEEREDRRSP